jgi:hypothetical protein
VKVYNILTASPLLYDCAAWTLKQRDIRRIKGAEMKFVRSTAGCTPDHRRNEDILKELKVDPVEKELAQNKNG